MEAIGIDTDIDNLDGKEVILNHIGILIECCATTLQECQISVTQSLCVRCNSTWQLAFSLGVVVDVLVRHSTTLSIFTPDLNWYLKLTSPNLAEGGMYNPFDSHL